MNIFWLDNNLERCAQYHNDKHVVKMVVEYTQLLSSSSRLAGLDQGYKLSHMKHPDNLWLLESRDNWILLRNLTIELGYEYTWRYGYVHKSAIVADSLKVPPIPSRGITKIPLCMPNQYKSEDYIKSYRNYYIGQKAGFSKWKRRDVPEWFNYNGILIK